MSNVIQIKHGASVPGDGVLAPYELGYADDGGLYIGVPSGDSTISKKINGENQFENVLYFDEKDGIGYNYGRVHMNSCDFSLENYTCVEEGDNTLETFHITRDEKSLIPMIKDAMEYGNIEMLVSPWSPPAYMKTTGKMNEGGKLKEEYFEEI